MSLFSDSSTFIRNIVLIVLGLIFYTWITKPTTITVTGYGDADVPATTALISLTITDIDVSPSQAKANLDQKVQDVKRTLLEAGVDSTKLLQSQPQIIPAATVSPGATGYAATVSMGGPTKQVQSIGSLTSQLYERGATLVAPPVLQNDSTEKIESEAMKEALKDADKQAKNISKRSIRLFRRVGAVVQADTPTTGTYTTEGKSGSETSLGEIASSNSFKISKAVQVTYLMW